MQDPHDDRAGVRGGESEVWAVYAGHFGDDLLALVHSAEEAQQFAQAHEDRLSHSGSSPLVWQRCYPRLLAAMLARVALAGGLKAVGDQGQHYTVRPFRMNPYDGE